MRARVAKKINDRAAAAHARKQPVPYTRRQVRSALHRLRQSALTKRPRVLWQQAVDYAAGPGAPGAYLQSKTRRGLTHFPWEWRGWTLAGNTAATLPGELRQHVEVAALAAVALGNVALAQ